MTHCWLIRHGEPSADALHRCYGWLDVPLSAGGRAQLARVAHYFRKEPLDAIYSSPLIRAMESAGILASGSSIPVHEAPDLREMHFGDFEGLGYDEIAARYPDTYRQWMETPAEVRFPGGEDFTEMRARVLRAFQTIQAETPEQTIAIVAHAGVIRILVAWALQMPLSALFHLAQDHAAVNLLTFVEGYPVLRLLNHRP
jgi:alpha-ribazole phosphatase